MLCGPLINSEGEPSSMKFNRSVIPLKDTTGAQRHEATEHDFCHVIQPAMILPCKTILMFPLQN